MSISQILSIVEKDKKKFYYDNKSKLSKQEYKQKLQSSKTVYIGNLSFYTTEQQIYSAFQRCGPIKDLHMGLNKYKKLPCGFCLLEFFRKQDANRAINVLHLSKLDGRQIKVEKDVGYSEGRQFGRGYEGGQKRDQRKNIQDQGRPQLHSFNQLSRKNYNDRRNTQNYGGRDGGQYRGSWGKYNQRRLNYHDNRHYHHYKRYNDSEGYQDENQRGHNRGKMYVDDEKQYRNVQQLQQQQQQEQYQQQKQNEGRRQQRQFRRNRSTSRENEKMYSQWD